MMVMYRSEHWKNFPLRENCSRGGGELDIDDGFLSKRVDKAIEMIKDILWSIRERSQ